MLTCRRPSSTVSSLSAVSGNPSRARSSFTCVAPPPLRRRPIASRRPSVLVFSYLRPVASVL
eukprot:3072484-Rhodomonas_salina.1